MRQMGKGGVNMFSLICLGSGYWGVWAAAQRRIVCHLNGSYDFAKAVLKAFEDGQSVPLSS